jgi:glucose-6-phosphate 1-dehydrogenase
VTDERGLHTSITRLLVLGGRGDLVSRHTLPALAHLEAAGSLPPALSVVAVDRETNTTPGFRTAAARLLDEHARNVPTSARARLVDRLEYRTADLACTSDLADLVADGPCLVYLALPPDVVPAAVTVLSRSSLRAGSRVLVEKPVGTDRTSAAALEAGLRRLVGERSVHRIDHFLHHQLLRDVLAVRFESALLEPLWSRRYVERVDVVWEEAAPVVGRTEFYDRTGALRDMVQSHLLQLLVAVAMEPPGSFQPADLRAARAEALSRVRAPDPTHVGTRTLRGRYVAGAVRSGPGEGTLRAVPAYVDEPGVDPARLTETYARVDLEVAGPRWEGVPFSLRTGRAIGAPRREVRVRFRPDVPVADGSRGRRPTLTFAMGAPGAPGSTRLSLGTAGGPGSGTSPWGDLVTDRPQQPLPASALLLRDALAGDLRWFLSAEEVDHAWRVVDAVLDAWRSADPPLVDYPAGSDGPEPRE